jgi:thymidylate synthase (FAD)
MKVLDYGHVEYVDCMGSDLTVANAARVSFNKETEWDIDEAAKKRLIDSGSVYHESDLRVLSVKDTKLIQYLAKHNHWTPFAHPQITLRVKAPISIRTQLFKHKQGFVENEISRRYVSDEPEIYHPRWRTSPTNGAKQGSEDFLEYGETWDMCGAIYDIAIKSSVSSYNMLIEKGIAPEQARFVLPQGTYTEWWWTGSLAAYARVCKLRSDSHAQWEVQQYANAISKIIEPLFPVSWKALTEKQVGSSV